MKSVLQEWVQELTFMQQSVLLTAVRGPDGLPKNHVAKFILRWFRRCVLYAAFERKIFDDPYESGGGSFTGPSVDDIDQVAKDYFHATDEVPHHFHLHLIHAAEIIGYKHPDPILGGWWRKFYFDACKDMHLTPETEQQMNYRLGDNEKQWREGEVVTAKGSYTL